MKNGDMNATQKAVEAGRLAVQVLEERGVDHDARMMMFALIQSDSEQGRKAYDQVWVPALEEANRRLAQGTEGTSPGPEKH